MHVRNVFYSKIRLPSIKVNCTIQQPALLHLSEPSTAAMYRTITNDNSMMQIMQRRAANIKNSIHKTCVYI